MEKELTGKKVAVIGLGVEGKDLVNFLLENKSDVTLFDQKPESELDFNGIKKDRLELSCGSDYLKRGFSEFDVVFRSPGIYPNILEFVKARKEGVIISSAMRLFFELCPAKIIGITGTKGKGTTSTLIYETLKKDKKDVYLAGNIGKPYLELLPILNKDSWVVLELSSFQLMDLHISPHIAVVLNITVDHLDWHKNREEYIEAKSNIVRFQSKNDFAVINSDYETPKSFENFTKGKVYYFSRNKDLNGSFIRDKKIILNIYREEIIGDTKKLQLRGEHNWENVTAAVCASFLAGAKIPSIKKSVFGFKGLEHRLELVRNYKGISFYNDSFSTNPQPTIAAIKSFPEQITLILGGSDKGLNYDEMAREIVENKNVKNIILIGQIAPIIKKSLTKAKFEGKIFDFGMLSMKEIVRKSFENAEKGGVVLLSPASASFGMFNDYKDRGNQFKNEISNLRE